MKKRLVYLGAFLVMFLSIMLIPRTVKADRGYFTVDGIRYQINPGTPAFVAIFDCDTSYFDGRTSIEIPYSVTYDGEDYNVCDIYDNAFNGLSNITSITINAWLDISNDAFSGLDNLNHVEFCDKWGEDTYYNNVFSSFDISKIEIDVPIEYYDNFVYWFERSGLDISRFKSFNAVCEHPNSYVYVPKQPATYDASGIGEYWYCTKCNHYWKVNGSDIGDEIGDETAFNAWKSEGGEGYIPKLVPTCVPRVEPTATTAGCKEYYVCSFPDSGDKYYEDKDRTTPIDNLVKWKALGGNGYIAPKNGGDDPAPAPDPEPSKRDDTFDNLFIGFTGKNVSGLSVEKQGENFNAAVKEVIPEGFVELCSFNLLDANKDVDYDVKKGTLKLNLSKFAKDGRQFRLIGVDEKGNVFTFFDNDNDLNVFATEMNIEAYAFTIIYGDGFESYHDTIATSENSYVVKAGDCLSVIADKFNTTIERIMQLNPTKITNENLIFAHDVLVINK